MQNMFDIDIPALKYVGKTILDIRLTNGVNDLTLTTNTTNAASVSKHAQIPREARRCRSFLPHVAFITFVTTCCRLGVVV